MYDFKNTAHAADTTETINLGKPLEAEGRIGVQVVEGVGLVASGFQFFSCLAALFEKEVDDFTGFV